MPFPWWIIWAFSHTTLSMTSWKCYCPDITAPGNHRILLIQWYHWHWIIPTWSGLLCHWRTWQKIAPPFRNLFQSCSQIYALQNIYPPLKGSLDISPHKSIRADLLLSLPGTYDVPVVATASRYVSAIQFHHTLLCGVHYFHLYYLFLVFSKLYSWLNSLFFIIVVSSYSEDEKSFRS